MKIQLKTKDLVIFESALFRTTTTLVFGEDYLILVDPNWLPVEIQFISDYISLHGKRKHPYLLFTHSDYDHIIGYGKFPDCTTIASQNFVENRKKAFILDQIKIFDDANYIERDYPILYPQIDIVITTNYEQRQIQGETYIFHQAEGHSQDGLLTYQESQGILIAGDYLSNIEFPYVEHSLLKYQQTLDKLETLIAENGVGLLVTGHGDFTKSKSEMLKRIGESRKYLNDLEWAVRSGQSFDLDQLFKRYKFPGIMKKFHEANLKLVQEELQVDRKIAEDRET